MNFYQHHIGDFNNATRHLSRIERSIYRDLLELYYDTEKPLTTDFDRLARRCLVDDCDRGAMREVLNEFFTLEDDGYHNTRADKEIAAYQRMAEGGKRGAEKRWGKGNDSPPIATPSTPHAKANANHEPITNNQEPIKTPAPKPAQFDPQWLPTPIGLKQEKWVEWVLYRSKIGRKPKPETWKKQIEFLESCIAKGINPADLIDESIRNGWQGLFEPKGQPRASPYESEKDRSRRETYEAMTGKKHEPANERIIDAFAERVD